MGSRIARGALGSWVICALACGGGGGSSGGTNPAAITLDTSLAIASGVVQGTVVSTEVGDIVGPAISDDAGAAQLLVETPGREVPASTTRAPFGPTPTNCDDSGSVVLSGDVATPGTYAVGDQVVGDFMMCDDGVGIVFDGILDLTVVALTGDLLGNDFDTTLDLVMTDLLADDGVEEIVLDGDGTLDYDVTQDPLITQVLAGSSLGIDLPTAGFHLMDYETGLVLDGNEIPEEYGFYADGRMTSTLFDGEVSYVTTIDFEGVTGDPPTVGEMVITGGLDATITVDPDPNGMDVDLLIDLDGSGSTDALIETDWLELGL